MPAASETHARFALLAVRPFASSKTSEVRERPCSASTALLRPRLTSHSARLLPLRRPFRREARSPQVRTLSFTARLSGLRRLSIGHRGFAALCPLAPLVGASYPIPVRQPTVSLPASFPRSVTLTQLRFASVGMTSSRRDLHPQDSAHAGRTKLIARWTRGTPRDEKSFCAL
jgi:hypothetical protein